MMFTSRIFKEQLKCLPALLSLTFFFTITISAQQSGGDNSQPKSPEPSTITGRVINESGQPLAGVAVSVGPFGGPTGMRTATDSEGNFKAPGLDPGTYRVFASLPAYVTEIPPGDANNPATYYRPGDSATLTLIKGGVIAGIVTNNAGEPLVNATVRVLRVRDSDGKPLRSGTAARERGTDDRGYYRIYGLSAGSYIVSAGGLAQFSGGPFAANPYANQAPTYAPASTRDTAVEIIVRSGEEATADIRFRGELGHSISGRITGVQTQLQYGVRLTDIESHAILAATGASGDDRTFQLNSVPDGDYEITALSSAGPNADLGYSSARRISVKGADVTGLEFTLMPLASIAGRVNIETDAKLNCGRHRDVALRETLITVRRARIDEKQETRNPKDKPVLASEPLSFLPSFVDAVPNDKSEINLRNLFPGVYRFETRLPGAGWYVKAITTGPNGPNIPRDGIGLKSGDKVTGLAITITEGAARLRGRISVAEGQRLPPGLRVYVVPAERDSAENVPRFFEASAESDGSFAIGNIAPGKYWVIAQPIEESDPGTMKSIKQDPTYRLKVLREAEALKKEISFKPCEQSADYDLPWTPPPRQ